LSNEQYGFVEILKKFHILNMNYLICKRWKG